ncbi:MAG: hypothetical protein IT379_26705 [Deltaproteobacteria bacterium]|nr:hypothetical protein [Deltaproteobacteria bacterium]
MSPSSAKEMPPLRIRGINFSTWLRNHAPDHDARWYRELYPWPVFARGDYAPELIRYPQIVDEGDVTYTLTVTSIKTQANQRLCYRVHLSTNGLGWTSRAWDHDFNLIADTSGAFITLFTAQQDPLKRAVADFFHGRWRDVEAFRSLSASRLLAATLASRVVSESAIFCGVEEYPTLLIRGHRPMFSKGDDLWIVYRFYAEDAYTFARWAASRCASVIALYFAETKYQYLRGLPPNATVISVADLDRTRLHGKYAAHVVFLLHQLHSPGEDLSEEAIRGALTGENPAEEVDIAEGDVQESLAALRLPLENVADLRYVLAAGVVINAWIDCERSLGKRQRKKFYAFKQQIADAVRWALRAQPPGVIIWIEEPFLYARVDNVDFSFTAIPLEEGVRATLTARDTTRITWRGVKLKPIAPIVLSWARKLRGCRAQHAWAVDD